MSSNYIKTYQDDDSIPLFALIPNILTMLGLCFGASSVNMALIGKFETAVFFVVIATIIDFFDGGVARILNAQSKLGAQLDSFADLVNFGFVPAFIMYMWQIKDIKIFGWGCVLLALCCMAIRLSRFNIKSEQKYIANKINDSKSFHYFDGFAAPISGLLILYPLIFTFEVNTIVFSSLYICIYIAFICLLMISKIPTFSLKKLRIHKKYANLLMLVISCIIILFIFDKWKVILGLVTLYVVLTPYSIYMSYKSL